MINQVTARALGISELTLRTWDSTLHRDLRVLVPIHVDALVVRQPGALRADCRMRTPAEKDSRRSIDLLPDPFTDIDAHERGVHLHWAAPDSLSRLAGTGANAAPTALPDRWLVARLAPGTGKRGVTAWVLESRTGTVTELDKWLAAPPEGPPVTALGIGDPGWVAYYDNVLNRFAFYDALEDVKQGPLAYLVCGWYADSTLDPLAVDLTSRAGFEARLTALDWALSADDLAQAEASARVRIEKATRVGLETPHAVLEANDRVRFAKSPAALSASGKPLDGKYAIAETRWPRATLFHGAVVGIGWPTADAESPEVGGPPASRSIAVSIGRTPSDALAALIADAAGSPHEAEWLNAFALGALTELGEPDGAVRLDDRLHDAAFVSYSDGSERVARPPAHFPEKKTPPRPKGGTHAAPAKSALDSSAALTTKTASVPVSKAISDAQWQVKSAAFHEVLVTGFQSEPVESAEMDLPRPRLFSPADPVIAVRGGQRSLKYGGDGRYTADGKLMCRLSSTGIRAIACRVNGAAERVGVRGYELFERPLSHGGIPSECEELLEELGLLDPGSSHVIAQIALARKTPGSLPAAAVAANAATNQTAWWATRSPLVDAPALLSQLGFEGRLPSPLAVRPATKPWVPLHLDWEVEYLACPARDFAPGEIDFAAPELPQGPGERFRGRSLLSSGVAGSLKGALDKYLAQEAAAGRHNVADADKLDSLTDIAERLGMLDVLAGPLERLHAKLRRNVAVDALPGAAPSGFVAVRAGFLRLTRLRLVDAYGQVLYLAGSSAEQDVDAEQVLLEPSAGVVGAPGILVLPPRFTAPSKLSFRFRDAARTDADAELTHSPIAGFVLPDHLDGALEFFDRDGVALGQLREDPDQGSLWERAPGLPTAVGDSPLNSIAQAELGDIAQSLFLLGTQAAPGEKTALTELLRAIDSTRWSIDPFAHVGEEHLSLLVGHPIAVVCAALKLEVREPVIDSDVPVTRVPVRLGALAHWQDGLLGFFLEDDFRVFHAAPAAAALARPVSSAGFLGPIDSVPGYAENFANDIGDAGPGATPIEHPYVDASGIVWVVPGVEYRLVLLVEPHCAVHATSCLLPRKQLAMPREWLAPPLGRIAPTFRFGPVLRDPKQIRMPIPADIEGAWTWTHREDVDRWAEEPAVQAGQEALLLPDASIAQEGWLRLTPQTTKKKD